MPKLNTTIDNIELKTNRVTGTVPSVDWTDAQYPSAKALYNVYSGLYNNFTGVNARCASVESTCGTLTTNYNNLVATCNGLTSSYNNFINIAHPVGSIMITSTNSNPASAIGGTWTLVDKGFAPYAASATNFFTPAANVTQAGTYIVRAGNTVRIRAALTVNAEVADAGMTLGTFNFSTIGITSLSTDFTGNTSYSDGANGGFSWNIDASSGALVVTDVFDTSKTASGNGFSFDVTVPIVYTQMLNGVCNRFYWRRTA